MAPLLPDNSAAEDRIRTRALAWTIVLTPALLLLWYVIVYAVNGAEWDHLSSAEIFYRWDQHNFTFEYLFRQHNEHRKAVARLMTLGLGLLTRWNNRPEAVMHWALVCATAVILFAAFRRDIRERDSVTRALLWFAPAAWLLTSPRSYEALLGDGFPHYCSIVGFAGALYFLIYARSSPGLAAAIFCGLVSSFSISNGLLIWPLGAVIIASEWRTGTDRRRVLTQVGIWALAGALTLAFYFHGYIDPGNHSGPDFVFHHPLKALAHFLATNGSCLAPHRYAAALVGGILLALDAWCLLMVLDDWWRRRVRPPLGAWLIVTVVISIMMITLNRAGFGVRQAMESRYTGISVLAPVGIYWCVVARRDSWHVARRMTTALTVFLLAGYLYAAVDAWAIAPKWYSRKSWMAYLNYSAKYQPTSLLLQLYPNADHGRIYSREMERMHYNVFAEEHVLPAQLIPGGPRPDYRVLDVNLHRPYGETPIEVGESGEVVVTGWAFNERRTGPARALFLTVDGTRDFPGHPGIYSESLGGFFVGRGRRWAAFTASFGGFVLEPGEHTLAVKIVADDGRRAFVSSPIARIIRR